MPLSSATLAKFRRAEFDSAMIVLLAITNELTGMEFRFAQNQQDVVSNGNTYVAYPFSLNAWPAQQEKDLPEIQISLSGFDDALRAQFLTLDKSKRNTFVQLYLVNSATPNTVDKQARARLFNYPISDATIDLICGYHDLLNDPLLTHRYNPSRNPGLFAGGIH